MHLQSLKTAIQGVLTQGELLRSPTERQTLYLHTCLVLTLLLETPDEVQPGWTKAALMLLSTLAEHQSGPMASLAGSRRLVAAQRTRPVVEVMSATAALTEAREHLQTLIELPDITTITSLDEILQSIEAAISVGAPRYNRGDIAGCARLYLATALTLVNAQMSRGFAGQARAMDILKKGVSEAQALSDVDKRAWALRHTFDRVLK